MMFLTAARQNKKKRNSNAYLHQIVLKDFQQTASFFCFFFFSKIAHPPFQFNHLSKLQQAALFESEGKVKASVAK